MSRFKIHINIRTIFKQNKFNIFNETLNKIFEVKVAVHLNEEKWTNYLTHNWFLTNFYFLYKTN